MDEASEDWPGRFLSGCLVVGLALLAVAPSFAQVILPPSPTPAYGGYNGLTNLDALAGGSSQSQVSPESASVVTSFNLPPATASASYVDPGTGGSASASVTFSGNSSSGVVHVSMAGSASSSPGSDGSAPNGAATISGSISWEDQVTSLAIGPSTPPGVLLPYLFSPIVVVQDLQATGVYSSVSFEFAVQAFDVTSGTIGQSFLCGAAGGGPAVFACQTSPQPFTLLAHNGDVIRVTETLQLAGTAVSDAVVPGSTFQGDISRSAYLNIDPLAAYASYSTASGLDYRSGVFPSSTPEPRSSLLLLAALGGMAAIARRRRGIRRAPTPI